MTRFAYAALAVAAFAFAAPAFAADDAASLRQPAIDKCTGGEGSAGGMPVEMCTCMVDKIIADFGDDTVPMLKILAAGYSPGQEAEIATLLGLDAAEAKVVIKRIDGKMDPVVEACMK